MTLGAPFVNLKSEISNLKLRKVGRLARFAIPLLVKEGSGVVDHSAWVFGAFRFESEI
jgi:hypothetical protein